MTRIVKNKNIIVCVVIGLTFLWTGSGYISWLYNLIDIISKNNIAASADTLSEVIGYFFQAFGIASIALLVTKKGLPKSNHLFILSLVTDMLLICAATLCNSFISVLCFGYLMNFFHGVVAAFYLFLLNQYVSPGFRGIVFGVGYSLGSVGSWIVSLIRGGNFLKSDYSLICYIVLMILTIMCMFLLDTSTGSVVQDKPLINCAPGNSFIILLSFGILILCITKGLGFYFPSADLAGAGISLEFSRAFYAIGLILAGLLNDYKRPWGAILCLASLFIPFVMLLLRYTQTAALIIWILGYIFTGFFAVYRVIVFSDLADTDKKLLFMAPLGLMWGRIGDAFGALIGSALSTRTGLLILVVSLFFILSAILFVFILIGGFSLHISNSGTVVSVSDQVDKIAAFSSYHDLSSREREVFPLIIEGNTNSEISSRLFVSENTVKFHVRNILKKTGCNNRQELFKCFEGYRTEKSI